MTPSEDRRKQERRTEIDLVWCDQYDRRKSDRREAAPASTPEPKCRVCGIVTLTKPGVCSQCQGFGFGGRVAIPDAPAFLDISGCAQVPDGRYAVIAPPPAPTGEAPEIYIGHDSPGEVHRYKLSDRRFNGLPVYVPVPPSAETPAAPSFSQSDVSGASGVDHTPFAASNASGHPLRVPSCVPERAGEAFKADTLLSVYCAGNLEQLTKDAGKINWDGWQRVADYVNRKAAPVPAERPEDKP